MFSTMDHKTQSAQPTVSMNIDSMYGLVSKADHRERTCSIQWMIQSAQPTVSMNIDSVYGLVGKADHKERTCSIQWITRPNQHNPL